MSSSRAGRDRRAFGVADAIDGALVLVATLLGVAAWPSLPSDVVVHFSADGTPGAAGPRAVGVLLVPAAMVATLVAIRAALRFDPPADERAAIAASSGTMALLAALQAILLAWNLGYAVPVRYVAPVVLLWAAALVSYALSLEQ